jgi:heptosyltransferase-2
MNLSGKTDLGTLAALFAEVDLVVSNDSGAMHLAAAVGSPVVAIFGSPSPGWTSPKGPRTRIVWRDEPCAPCYADNCDIGIVCLDRITPDEVLEACRSLLA